MTRRIDPQLVIGPAELAAGADLLDAVQSEISELLTTIGSLIPMVVQLTDTRQRGLGFVTL